MSEQPTKIRSVEYRGLRLEIANSDQCFWSVAGARSKELNGVFTDLRSAHAAIDLYLNRKGELERADLDTDRDH
jgi:hypothetical protein